MKAVTVTAQGPALEEQPIPMPRPGEVVIRVEAASVNPIDTLMSAGYGESLFKWLRRDGAPKLGLDAAGTVTAAGANVKRPQVGQKVVTALMPFRSGGYAEYVAAPEKWVAEVPEGLPLANAAAAAYAGLTIRQVLKAAGLYASTSCGKRVLVHGGSGGIGHLLIQLLHAWGAWVATTCSTGNVDWVTRLGANKVVDYKKENFVDALADMDVVINTIMPAGERLEESPHFSVLRPGGHYVSLISPTLTLANKLGAPLGIMASGGWMGLAKGYWRLRGKHHHWVYFAPGWKALEEVMRWQRRGWMTPHIGHTFSLEEFATAHEAVKKGPARGKVMLDCRAAAE